MDDLIAGSGSQRRAGSAESILDALAADECRAFAGRELTATARSSPRRIDPRGNQSAGRSDQSAVASSEAFVERATVFLKHRADAAGIIDEIVKRLDLDLKARGHARMEASPEVFAAPTDVGEDGEFDPLDDQFGTTPASVADELPTVSPSAEAAPARNPSNAARGRNGRSAKSGPPPTDPQERN